MTDAEEAEWVAEHVSALRVQDKEAKERGITAVEIAKWYKTKVRNYFRCITCASQPVRERSHFQRRQGKFNTKPCRRQRLTHTEEAAWITTHTETLRNETDASAEAHRIIAKRLKSSQHLAVKSYDNTKQNVCKICTKKFPGVPLSIGQHCCAVCHRSFELETPAQRSNHRQSPDRALVCTACRENGYYPKDVCTYECRSCNGLFGRKNFSSRAVQNFIQRKRGNLTCGRCSASSAGKTTTARQNANPKRKDREFATHNRVDTPGDSPALSMMTTILAEVRNQPRSAGNGSGDPDDARRKEVKQTV